MRIDTRSPERGWGPFTDWLTEHGIDPNLCFAVDLGEGEDPQCVAHLYAVDADGKKYVDKTKTEIVRQEPMAFLAKRPAPRRIWESAQ